MGALNKHWAPDTITGLRPTGISPVLLKWEHYCYLPGHPSASVSERTTSPTSPNPLKNTLLARPTTLLLVSSRSPVCSRSRSSIAMARIFSQTLIRQSQTLIHDPARARLLSAPATRLEGRRGRANRPEKVQLVEVDLETEAAGPDVEVLGIRRLEDAIHGIIVRRSAPDWLPFIPGSSYWVPPRKRPHGVVELIGKIANPMTEEETLSLTSVRGWPSSAYFVEGVSPHPVKKSTEKAAVQSDDEES